MKKTFLLFVILIASLSLKAQNIQLHYDMGETRNLTTATIEMFRPDKHGSTFFFVDMDFGGKAEDGRTDGMNLAYFEIARGFKFWESPLEMTIEYNGGFGRGEGFAYPINSAYLLGPSYTLNSKDWSKIVTFKALYKYIDNQGGVSNFNNSNFQFTTVWTLQFFDKKLTCSGFLDFWTEKVPAGSEIADFVFLTEPQFWYNFNKNFSLGTEIELSSNFAQNDGFMVNPTIAAKYTF